MTFYSPHRLWYKNMLNLRAFMQNPEGFDMDSSFTISIHTESVSEFCLSVCPSCFLKSTYRNFWNVLMKFYA